MPKQKIKDKKYWFTYAFFTREGELHAAHRLQNFTRWHGQISMLLSDLKNLMSTEAGHKGAYVAAVWPGQIDEWEGLHGSVVPLYYVYQNKRVDRL